MAVFADLKKLRPFCVVAQVEAQVIGFRQRIKITLGQFIEIVTTKSSKCGHR